MAESRRPGSPEAAIETVSAVQVASEIRRRMGNRTAGSPRGEPAVVATLPRGVT
jgi:hypothetical protein